MTDTKKHRRALSHFETVYRPGDRELVKSLFDALGLQVAEMGKYVAGLIPCDESANPLENALFASEITPEHWEFEQALGAELRKPELASRSDSYLRALKSTPQNRPHFGIAFSSLEDWTGAVQRIRGKIAAEPALKGRAEVASEFRPWSPGAQTDFLYHAFVHTDIIGTGLLSLGLVIELQHYSRRPM